MTGQSAVAVTEEAIEASITDGIAWLAGRQMADGSWSGHTAYTCLALIKLQDRAYELENPATPGQNFTSPFDPLYVYSANVLAGWQFVLDPTWTQSQDIGLQGGEDPDTNGNGYGVRFMYDVHHRNYTTGICLMALASSGDPARPNDGALAAPLGGATYGELAQDAADWLAWSQTDGPDGDGLGGWDYDFHDNVGFRADNSISGYVTLGLAAAQNFGVTVPQWVKDRLSIFIDVIQDVSVGPNNGGSWYTPDWDWTNEYKTGHLLFEMTFVGDANTSPRFEAALGYIEEWWQSGLIDVGWGYNQYPANYQAMFSLMKGLEFSNVQLIDTDGDTFRDNDWFNQEPTASPSQDFASVLVAQQNPDGSWPTCLWGSPDLCTTWALLTLEMIVPVAEQLSKEITSGPDVLDPTNLIADGDFDALDTDPDELNGAQFILGSGAFNEWYRLSPWHLATVGASGEPGDQFLAHAPFGGSDQRAFQVIDASGMAAGAKLKLEFDYIFNEGDLQIQGVYVGLVGIKDDGIGSVPPDNSNPNPPKYVAFGGTGWDGWGFGPNVNPDAVVLNTLGFDPTAPGMFAPGLLEATLDQAYDAIVVVLMAESWKADVVGPNEGMRGFDNVQLYASDGIIDLVVEKKPSEPIHYDFTITYTGQKEDVIVVDTLPAEWNATYVNGDVVDPLLDCGDSQSFTNCADEIELFKGGKVGKKCKSATNIWWMPVDKTTLKIDAQTRESPGKGHKEDVFAPTSCGALYLNEGAAAYPAVDGEPLLYLDPLHVSNVLCVAVVSDVNGDGIIVRDGTGDEDGDTLTDYEEACEIGTDPCLYDTDGDGVWDNVDECPLQGPADPALGEILEPNGCIRQSQCTDGIDNDLDGLIDSNDPGCDDPLDDDEFNAVCDVPFSCGDPITECVEGAGEGCFCVASAEGVNSCIANQSCTSLAACTASSECGAGEACIVNTCCGGGVCIVIDICLDPAAAATATVDFSEGGLTLTGS